MAENPFAPATPDVDVVVVTDSDAQLDPPHDVFIHNDDITPFDFVVNILTGIFELTEPDAWRVAYKAHHSGKAYVCTLGLEEAKYRVSKAVESARASGYPLSFTIEPGR